MVSCDEMEIGLIKNERRLTQALERMRQLVRKNPESNSSMPWR